MKLQVVVMYTRPTRNTAVYEDPSVVFGQEPVLGAPMWITKKRWEELGKPAKVRLTIEVED